MSEEQKNEPQQQDVAQSQPPPVPQQQPQQAPPQNYLVLAILSTIFCCWPLGIPAIVFAAQVNSKFAQGDVAGAEEASKKAKMWSFIALGVGALLGVLYAGSMLLTILFGSSGN